MKINARIKILILRFVFNCLFKPMKHPLFLIILTFTLSCAHTQDFKPSKLTVLNLEEDKGPFATLNDEIVLWVVKINIEKDVILSWEHSDEMIFSDSIPSHTLNFKKQVKLDSNDILIIALVELDNNHSMDSINLQLKKTISSYYGFPTTLLQEKIRLAIRDDDILGLVSFGFEDKQLAKKKHTFKGMHMFNRYEYELRF